MKNLKLHHDYSDKVSFVAISSNDVINYPEDSPEKMRELWIRLGFLSPTFTMRLKMLQKHFKLNAHRVYLFNAQHSLVYRGRCDATSLNQMNNQMAKIYVQLSILCNLTCLTIVTVPFYGMQYKVEIVFLVY